MKPAKIDVKKEERIALLKEYSILDSLPEKDYDNLTKLAAEICNTPISLITLLDDKRQWFKSNHGLDATETPIEQAFCAHAITGEDTFFSVEDAKNDKRFKDNPLVTGQPQIVFYGGIALKNASGTPIGTLCVIDNKPRKLSSKQIEALKILSDQVMNLMALRKSKLDLERANEKLEVFSAKLEKKVRQRTKQLETRTKKLELINEELASFNHIFSHDLQEPLRKIQMFISQINSSELERLSEKGKHKLGRIIISANLMRDLIQDLLKYGATKGIQQERVNLPLSEIVSETVDVLLHDEFASTITTLKVLQDCEVSVIPIQFKQMLFNLFSNSLKFRRADTPMMIEIKAKVIDSSRYPNYSLEPNSTYTRIVVSDNGIGFDEKYKHKIFGIFQRLHSDKEYQGNGIGLALVKRVVRNHNGQIMAQSKVAQGSRFEIFIPLNS